MIYIKSKAKYPVAVLGSINYSDKNRSIVMLDMKKKIIIKTDIKFELDTASEALVSYNKKYLAYTIYTEESHEDKLFIRNLENKTDKQVLPYNNESSIINIISWINNKTLLYSANNSLCILDVESFKSRTIRIPDSSLRFMGLYYPRNNGFIIGVNKDSNMNYESSLYLIDSKGEKQKLLKDIRDYFIMDMKLVPGTDNILIEAVRVPYGSQLFPEIYIYNIKSGSYKLLIKQNKEITGYADIFPYDKSNFLFQHNHKLYNANIQTGKYEEFRFRNQEFTDAFVSFTIEQ